MSNYADYSTTAASYDATRAALGTDIILGSLAERMPLAEAALLDLGCGTGNYTAALAPHLREIEALDLNPAMLDIARRKIATAGLDGRVRFHHGAADALPIDTSRQDAVCINQMLHHLPVDDVWSSYRLVFDECARVLRPGGVLIINTCSRQQLQRGFWPYQLAPAALDECVRVHIPDENLRALLEDTGFATVARVVPVDAVLQGEAYFDSRGPLDAAWRDGDSFWALVGDAELAAATVRVRELDTCGRLDAFVQEHDRERPLIGQVSFYVAERG